MLLGEAIKLLRSFMPEALLILICTCKFDDGMIDMGSDTMDDRVVLSGGH